MEILSSYIPLDRRQAISRGIDLAEHTQGAALFADISGFTPLTEALARELGPQRAAEALTRQLNEVYDAVIIELHRYGGSVISFSGDAITCWFDQDNGLHAVTCALAMQEVMKQFSSVTVPSSKSGTPGMIFTLAMKSAVATGSALRCVVGNPQIQLIDVLAGSTLERLVAAEHLAERGEVVLEPQVIRSLRDILLVSAWRQDQDTGEMFCAITGVENRAKEIPQQDLLSEALSEEVVKPWLLPPVYERLRLGQEEFLAELRPAVAMFMNFSGIDYDQDENSKSKLDAYIRWVQHVVNRYEGYLLQLTVGDKGSYLYASFGAPIAHEDDAIRAASAALELRTPPPELDYIRNIKIGISQGRVFSGAYGGKFRRTYGVMGDDVNLAARLMMVAEPGQILAKQSVQTSAGLAFVWQNLPPIRVKGKTELIEICSLIETQSHRALRLTASEYTLSMVGRQEELAIGEEKLELALAGQGQIIGITGEAGIGKSRLIAEIIHRSSSRGLASYGGECQSYGTETSYLVWQPIWRGLFEIETSISAEEQIEKLKERLEAIDPQLIPRLPLLGPALSLSIPHNELTASLDAKLRKASLEALLVDCLRYWAHQHPIVLVLEDCQWMDALSHDLLEVIGRAISNLPVLTIVAYRPPEVQRLQKPRISVLPNFTEILLQEFSTEQARQLIGLKLIQFNYELEKIPGELVNRIITQAGGNPFYIEELLNYLKDQGIDPQAERALEQLDLPTSLHSLILSRLDQLSETQQITIKVASIIGRLFRAALLWGTYPELGGVARVQSALEDLSRIELTAQEASEQELTYFFKQIVTQQVAYENLPFSTRALLHNQLALYIESNYPKIIEQNVDLLAFHFLKGDNWNKALDYNLRAARRAQLDFANDAAMISCQHALEAAERLGTQVDSSQEYLEIYSILGEVLMMVGRYDEAIQQYEKALKLLENKLVSEENKHRSAELCRKIAEVYERRSEYEIAFEWLESGLAFLDQSEPTIEAARIYLLGSGLYHRQAKNDEAVFWNHRAQTIAQRIQSREAQQTMAQTIYLLGNINWKRGDFLQSIEMCEQSLNLYQDIDDIVGQMKAYNNLAIPYADMGRWDQAREAYLKSLEIAQKIGDVDQQGRLSNNLALILTDQGDWNQATTLLEKSISIYKQVGAVLPEAVVSGNLAQVLIYRGELEQAQQLLEQSESIFASVGTDDFSSELERHWGELYMKKGALDQALTHAQRSIELAIEQEGRLDEGLGARLLGEIYLEKGDMLQAEKSLNESHTVLSDINSEFEACRTILSLARLKFKTGDAETIEANLTKAISLFENLGARPYLETGLALRNQLH